MPRRIQERGADFPVRSNPGTFNGSEKLCNALFYTRLRTGKSGLRFESAVLLSRRFPSFMLDIQSGIWLNRLITSPLMAELFGDYSAEMQALRPPLSTGPNS